jgi:hypothetical protein
MSVPLDKHGGEGMPIVYEGQPTGSALCDSAKRD